MTRSSGHFPALALLLAFLLAACGQGGQAAAQPAAPESTISISGAFALFPMVTVWTAEYQKLHPNVTFDVQAGGAGKGMTDMLAGAVDIAMLSREPRQEELDQGAFALPVTIDAVVATVNAKNPVLDELLAKGITPALGAALWLTPALKTWGEYVGGDDATAINVYTRSDSAGAAEMWARFLGGTAQEELKGTAVNGDPGLAEAVRQDPAGIGFNNIGFAYDPATLQPIEGLAILPIDLNGDGQVSEDERFYASRDQVTQAIADQVYPFPPARVLYLVTKGEPNPATVDFYHWVLSDGQSFVTDAGYVKLTDARLQEARSLLEE
jgi:phosphate transport system substrate-binding protein